MKKYYLSLIILLLTIGLVACGSSNESNGSNGKNTSEPKKETSEELTIKHELGETKVKKNPKKVVVFDFGMLDTLDKLGVEVTGVPQSGTVPPYLSKYADSKYINVGSLKEPDFEKIAEIDPDLIIISGRQAELYEDLSELGPTVYVGLDFTKYMDSYKENVAMIGQIFGKEDVVKEELAKVDDQIAKVKDEVTGLNKNALIILANEGKISAYGAGSRFGLIHDVLGFTPVDPKIEVSTHGQSVSFEYVVEKNPDYLFVIDRTAVVGGNTNAKDLIENDLVKNTKAFKEGHIIYLDPNYWYLSGGGLESVPAMITEVENAIK
ncbi:siderophore ABC transporter substrate-binding protein [Bacillus andreraoultii]|uniref:siderophore ABC transporter substrate-binding protein n=1 Tax=Bacillus andreraoultii TaxID=1499685 RepID=UPI00053A579F|nr:siderophore ABC transporter substrate-binding protein [Bacillus andreraoultii]